MGVDKCVIYDTRERHTFYVDNLIELGHSVERKHLNSADVTFSYNGKDYREDFLIEKKANYNEIYNNITAKKKQFKNEFKRMITVPCVILLIEQKNPLEAMRRLKKRNFKMDIVSFPVKFDLFLKYRQYERAQAGVPPIKVVYCDKYKTAETIIKLINDYLKHDLSQLSDVKPIE